MKNSSFRSVSFDSTNPTEIIANEIREKVLRSWKLREFHDGIEDEEDQAQNILVRLLEHAQVLKVKFAVFATMTEEARKQVVWQKEDAERSAQRRARDKSLEVLCDKLDEWCDKEKFSLLQCHESLIKVRDSIRFSELERELFLRCYVHGEDYEAMSVSMGMSPKRLHNLNNKVLTKLRQAQKIVEEVLFEK